MSRHVIAALSRGLAGSRRSLLGGALAASFGLGGAAVEAGNGRKGKKSKPKPNQFGCLNVGSRCQNGGQCCSGRCRGKKGKKRCRAHDVGTCRPNVLADGCTAPYTLCTTSAGEDGGCATTTGNAAYCYATGECYDCQTDADCQVAHDGNFGPGAACIRCAECPDSLSGTACVGPAQSGPVQPVRPSFGPITAPVSRS